jgi:hypothetical protein
MNQYNVVMIGDKAQLSKARVYMQNFMPFERGNPDGWVLSKENLKYVGECHALKTINKEVAELVTKTLRNIERLAGLVVLDPAISKLED